MSRGRDFRNTNHYRTIRHDLPHNAGSLTVISLIIGRPNTTHKQVPTKSSGINNRSSAANRHGNLQ
jgi:hypothetical protein